MEDCTIACQLLTWGKGIRKMRDKERILMIIISRIIPGLTSCTAKKEDYIRPFIFNTHELKAGDLVMTNTTIFPNEFMVGFVHEVKSDCVVIIITKLFRSLTRKNWGTKFLKVCSIKRIRKF